ncbi:MAG: hypothetical protein OYH77_02405 [Pseudomonadota bacterium]|nr:hypothetical protein [Pseudomonadota bacterium]
MSTSYGRYTTRRLSPTLVVSSLFRYEGVMRDLLLRAKIQNSSTASYALLKLMYRHRQRLPAGEVIVPAAASFWGRLRGRSDIAWVLARSIAKQRRGKFMEAPLPLHWRWRKQSHLRRAHTKHKQIRFTVPNIAVSILLVDDVVTSGATLLGLADYFGADAPKQAFTLFSAAQSSNAR